MNMKTLPWSEIIVSLLTAMNMKTFTHSNEIQACFTPDTTHGYFSTNDVLMM